MSKRTPLGTSPSFNGGLGNPFNPSETEFHAYWGVYVYDAAAPNNIDTRVGSVGSAALPNEQNNPLTNPEFSKLRVGDTASTAFNLATASGGDPGSLVNAQKTGLFVCVYPGLVGGGDAVWERLDEATALVQTVRDAHVIVVAQAGYVTVAGSPPPYNLADGAGVLADYIDTGNGAQFALSLLAAAAASVPIDVRLRPCALDLDLAGAPAVPLSVPTDCRLIGAGRLISRILSKATAAASQEVFILDSGSEMIDLHIESPAQAAPGAGASSAVVRTAGANVRVKDCAFEIFGATRTQPWVLWDTTGTIEVMGTSFAGADQTDPATKSIGIVVGDPTVVNSFAAPGFDYEISDCLFTSINRMLHSYNVAGGSMQDCEGEVVRPTGGAILLAYAGVPAATLALAPRLTNIRIVVAGTETVADPNYFGVRLTNFVDTFTVASLVWTAIQVVFASGGAPTIPRIAYEVQIVAAAATIEGGTLTALTASSHAVGVRINSAGAASFSRISDLLLVGCMMRNPVTIGAFVGTGFDLITATLGEIRAVSIASSNASGVPATGFGVRIRAAASTNTIVLGNQLVPAGGTALSDLGTTTEAGHNILV